MLKTNSTIAKNVSPPRSFIPWWTYYTLAGSQHFSSCCFPRYFAEKEGVGVVGWGGHAGSPAGTYEKSSALVSWGCCNSPADWVASATDIYFSSFWRLEVGDQGVSKIGFSWSLSPYHVDVHLVTVPSHCICTWLSIVCPNILWGHLSYWIRTLPMTSLNYLFKNPVSKGSHTVRC